MKQYDKIWIPDNNGEYGAFYLCPEVIAEERISSIDGPIICMTMEELRECFDAGWKRCAFEKGNNSSIAPDFHNYLTSKGITL